MTRIPLFLFLLAAFVVPSPLAGQAGASEQSVEVFKVGTFEISGQERVGIVLRDQFVVDLVAANEALQSTRSFPARAVPNDMIGLIEEYENGLKERIYAIVNELVEGGVLSAGSRPGYIHEVAGLRTLPPIPRPGNILNAAVNFFSHVSESGTPEQRQAAIEARRANRGVPYMFIKPASSVIGHEGTILMPYGRDRLDWEIELATVIGRPTRYVPAPMAEDHVFGYTIMLDISDRGGRPPGGFSSGVDWFVMKGQDTFGPMGPWIVPKEFYGDPMEKLNQTLLVGDQQMQQANAGDMIHSVWEVIEYASSLLTLSPGDIINAGTSGGVGMGTSVRGEQVWLVPGDEITATIDGIGTMRLSVAPAPAPPEGTGSYLPPVSSYRGGGPGPGGGAGN